MAEANTGRRTQQLYPSISDTQWWSTLGVALILALILGPVIAGLLLPNEPEPPPDTGKALLLPVDGHDGIWRAAGTYYVTVRITDDLDALEKRFPCLGEEVGELKSFLDSIMAKNFGRGTTPTLLDISSCFPPTST